MRGLPDDLGKLAKKMKEARPEFWLALIIIFALFVRLYFFIGLVSSDPQDDGIYYNKAYSIYRGTFSLGNYDSPVNPAETFNFRFMINYPIAFLFHLFGPGEFSAGLWSLLCSLGTITCTFYLGKFFIDAKTGLMSSFLVSFFPLDVIYSTRILPDIVLAFFVILSLALFAKAMKGRGHFFLLSGVALGLAYLTKITALVFLPVFFLWLLYKKEKIKPFAFFILGLLVVFSLEAAWLWSETGDPLAHYKTEKGSVEFKYSSEPVGTASLGPVMVKYNTGKPVYHLSNAFSLGSHKSGVNLFGVLYFTAVFGSVLSLYRKKNLVLVFWFVFILLWLEFGFIGLDFQDATYYLIFKDPRFLAVLTPAVAMLSSFFLLEVWKLNDYVFLIAVFFLLLSSFALIKQDYDFYRSSIYDLREASSLVRDNPQTLFFSDYLAVNNLNILTNHRMENMRYMDRATRQKELEGSYVILGGSRGLDVMTEYVTNLLPSFATRATEKPEDVPEKWVLVKEIKGEKSPVRANNMRIYFVS